MAVLRFAHNASMLFRYCLVAFLPLLLFSIGCGPKNELGRQAVTGQIRLDGVPLDRGTIMFAPEQPRGVSAGAQIEDGSYSIEAHQGLTAGRYIVRIYAADDKAETVAPELPGPGIRTQPERIPFKYNLRSESTLDVDGSADAATFDLDMETGK